MSQGASVRRPTTSAPWGVAAIVLAFAALFAFTVTTYADPSASRRCAATPMAEVVQGRRAVSSVDAEGGPRTTDNPCLGPGRQRVIIGGTCTLLSAASAAAAFRRRP